MEEIDDRLFVQHGKNVTFVTFNDQDILNAQRVKELEEETMVLVEQARRLHMVLDFCNVKHLTSAFLGLVVKVHKRIRKRGGHLKLQNVDPDIYKLFEITGLTKVLDIS
jgi:anti-sigma B factor antagonist